jgi:hypothetical protein
MEENQSVSKRGGESKLRMGQDTDTRQTNSRWGELKMWRIEELNDCVRENRMKVGFELKVK